MDKKIEEKLNKNSYRALTKKEIEPVLKELEQIAQDKYEFPDYDLTKFDDNLLINDKIYLEIAQDLKEKQQKKYFLYLHKGKKSSLNPEDMKPNIYVCFIHPKYPRKFVAAIKYFEFKQLINNKDNNKQEEIKQEEKIKKEKEENFKNNEIKDKEDNKNNNKIIKETIYL